MSRREKRGKGKAQGPESRHGGGRSRKKEKRSSIDEERIVRFLSREAGRPLTIGELGDELNVPL